MSKAHDKNQGASMIILGVILAYSSNALKGNIFQSAFLIGGIVIFAFGVFLVVRGYGLIQLGKAKMPKQTGAGADVKQNDVLSALNMRYAKGEITRDQYEQMKKDLE